MAASQAMVSAQVLGAYDFRRHRRLLDVGGGDGTFLRSVAAAAPDLELSLFDLPAVTALARRRFAEAGVEADLHGGDFFHDPLPRGADLISFVRVLHDHGDAAVLGLLHQARAALPAGGSVLVAEPMAGVSGAERVGDAYFGFYLLAMGSGRPRTVEENRNLLLQAGFSRVRRVRTALPMIAVVLVAHN
jgi:demethylspheroidene O-methyltransferase